MFLDKIADYCNKNLLQKSSKIPLAYLLSRGITFDDIKKYNIGYTGTFLPKLEEDHDELADFNKWSGYRGKYIKNRLVFPIYDEKNQIKGIETRALDRRSMNVLKPQYKKSLKILIDKLPESEIRYKKFYLNNCKFTPIFFGLPHNLESIWEKRTVFLTEGIFDLISLMGVVDNCISPLTANLSKYQMNWLKRYADKVILLFDMDKKGKEAVEKLKEMLSRDLVVHNISLKGKDVNEFINTYGKTDLKYHIEESMDMIF
jgi:DNA primase